MFGDLRIMEGCCTGLGYGNVGLDLSNFGLGYMGKKSSYSELSLVSMKHMDSEKDTYMEVIDG